MRTDNSAARTTTSVPTVRAYNPPAAPSNSHHHPGGRNPPTRQPALHVSLVRLGASRPRTRQPVPLAAGGLPAQHAPETPQTTPAAMARKVLVIVVRADPIICGHSTEARNLAVSAH